MTRFTNGFDFFRLVVIWMVILFGLIVAIGTIKKYRRFDFASDYSFSNNAMSVNYFLVFPVIYSLISSVTLFAMFGLTKLFTSAARGRFAHWLLIS